MSLTFFSPVKLPFNEYNLESSPSVALTDHTMTQITKCKYIWFQIASNLKWKTIYITHYVCFKMKGLGKTSVQLLIGWMHIALLTLILFIFRNAYQFSQLKICKFDFLQAKVSNALVNLSLLARFASRKKLFCIKTSCKNWLLKIMQKI